MLHQNITTELIGIEIIIENPDYIRVVDQMKQLYLSNKVGKQFLPVRFRQRRVLLAHEFLVENVIAEQHGLATCALTKLPNKNVVAATKKVNELFFHCIQAVLRSAKLFAALGY